MGKSELLLMLMTNHYTGDTPYTENYSWWWHTSHRDFFMVIRNQHWNILLCNSQWALPVVANARNQQSQPSCLPSLYEPLHDKTNKMTVRPAKTQITWASAQSSLCGQWVANDPRVLQAEQRRLIRLGGCPGWSESSLGAQIILLVLSWGGSHFLE